MTFHSKLTIANAHSENQPTEKMTLTLEGGYPWCGYLWINDVCYTVTKGPQVVKVKRSTIKG